ncbi:MAG: RluA family pseudouridine synthase [Ruminococcus sp.]|nr:RluA family pseudouridine synthase [Ruminococcus sp.]
MRKLELIAGEKDNSQRLDKFLSENINEMTRSALTKLIDEEKVTVNFRKVVKSYKLSAGDIVTVSIDDPEPPDVVAEEIPLDIVYEDDDLLVVNKPKGMVVHPAAGNYSGTLVNALLYHCGDSLSGINGVLRPGIVHRIDKNTSGLLMVAKNDFAHQSLSEQIQSHSFKREYLAVVYGNIKDDRGVINAPIGRHKTDRKKMCVTKENGREAVTRFEVLERFSDFTYLCCMLETGRTHQIRVHMAYIGHPLAGDDVYGPKKVITSLGGQCLHAYLLGFVHPRSGEYMEFTSEVPETFAKFLTKLRNSQKNY